MVEAATPSPRREVTRQRLMDAAAQVFAEVGLDATSVEAICERAGFTRGAFYSNFETKEELFLDLARQVARERVAAARERVAHLERAGLLSQTPNNAFEIVKQVLDVSRDDRLGILLMAEIRIRALRDPQLAAAYIAQDDELCASVAQIVRDIAAARVLSFRLAPEDAARLMITVWEQSSVRAAMQGLQSQELHDATNEAVARVAQLVVAPPDAESTR